MTTGRAPYDPAAQLRDAGLKATGPRTAVLGALADLGGHRTADEVRDLLADRDVALPRSSVYNILRDLTEARLVMTADAGHGAALYELGGTWHHHFVCTGCGQVRDVECVIGAKPCLDAGDGFGRIDEAQVIFRGVCPSCLTAER
jgi:Fur family ferric uptake transcriptional regulator